MSDRGKTSLILGASSLFMFSPLVMVLAGYKIRLFQNLGFARSSIASPMAWILAAVTAIAYVVYTMRAIPFIAGMQREISLFKLLGICAAVVGGIVEEVFFRRWGMDMLLSRGFGSVPQVVISGIAFGLAHSGWAFFAKHNLKFSLPAVLSTSTLGVLLAVIYLVGGRNLGPCIAAHAAINIVIEPWLMLSAVSGKRRT
jgi:uncharacterized protein